MKILFTDFDGTLATDDKKISAKDFSALKVLHDNGVKIVLSTGRMTASAKQLLKLFPCDVYLTTFNGGEIIDIDGKMIERNALAPVAAAKIVAYAKKQGLFCQIYSDEVVSEELTDYTKSYGKLVGCGVRASDGDLAEYILKNDFITTKVQICDFSGNIEESFKKLIEEFGDEFEYVRVEKYWINVSPKGINKGYALERVCKYLGISTVDAVAIGDDNNDISMIKKAGIGVAVSNATGGARLAADMVTKSANGGAIAEITEKIFGFHIR